MEFVLFTLFSSAEYVAVIILMFTLFRFRFKGYRKQIALTSFILCYVSYTMRLEGMANTTTIVQLILFFLMVWILFQVQVFYAAIMSFSAFIGYGMLQTLIVLVTSAFGILKISDYSENTLPGYGLQITSALIYSLLGWWIRKKNKGFDFVPTSKYGQIRYTKLNSFFLLVLIICTCGIFLVIYFLRNENDIKSIIVLFIIFVISFIFVLYLSNRKEEENG